MSRTTDGLRVGLLRLRNSLNDQVCNHRLRSEKENTEHARGWYNAYEECAMKINHLLDDYPATQGDAMLDFMKPQLDKTDMTDLEKRAMRSAVAWYVTFLERERDNRG